LVEGFNMMRRNRSSFFRAVTAAVLAVCGLGISAATAVGQTVHLIAAPFSKSVTLPNNTSVAVPMWGYALDDGDGVLEPGEVVSSPASSTTSCRRPPPW
jgi:hypothetical protein